MLFTREELRTQGLTDLQVQRRLRARTLFRVARGYYATANPQQMSPEERHLQLVAGLRHQVKPGSVLSHASAGVLHGLWVSRRALNRMHVTRRASGNSVSRRVHVHRALGDVAVEEKLLPGVGPVPVTDLASTTVALLRLLDPLDAIAVADSALRVGLQKQTARGLLAQLEGHPGTRRARRTLEFSDPLSESPGESKSRWIFHTHQIPAPVLQQNFHTPSGQWVARTDFWWPEHNLIGEFDGNIKYGRLLKPGQSLEDVIRAERAREVALLNLGHRLTRWVSASVNSPADLAQQITRLLTSQRAA